MKKRFIFCALLAAVLVPGTIVGVPSRPTPFVRQLPDGTRITIFQRGDEKFHFLTTIDGYPLIEKPDGYLYYAVQEADSGVIAGSIKARDADQRSPAETELLSHTDKETVTRALVSRREKNPAKYPGYARTAAEHPTLGTQKALVILVQYQDKQFSIAQPQQAYDDMLNQQGYTQNGAIGSARDYYTSCSNGLYLPDFDVYGPITLANNMSYYGQNDYWGNDAHPHEMVIEACNQLNATVDFTEYDSDNDGFIDNVYVFYAGYGEADGGSSNTVWPHSWAVYRGAGVTAYYDGVQLDSYACSNELKYGGGMNGIGTFCHEYSHVLGLPDLYATSYTGALTPGEWELMDGGSYNGDGKVPPYMSVYDRYALGWLNPTEIIKTDTTYTLKPISENEAFLIKTNLDNEYFLLENRQKDAWDTHIPGHGMLIWHIDYNEYQWSRNTVNNNPNHQYVDIEEADNVLSEWTRSGDAFPGTSNVTRFNDETSPNMRTWANAAVNKPLSNIREENGIIKFRVGSEVVIPNAPAALKADEITSSSFRAKWESVAYATDYELDVYRKTGDGAKQTIIYLPNYQNRRTGNVTSMPVEGLTPETRYYYRVRAVNANEISENSNEVEVFTTSGGFGDLKVSVLEATEITENSFTANWEQLESASHYIFNLNKHTEEGQYKETWEIPEYTELNVGNQLLLGVRNLTPNTEYSYTIKASDGSIVTRPSEPIIVKTLLANKLNKMETHNRFSVAGSKEFLILESENPTCFSVFNSLGMQVRKGEFTGTLKINLPKGIYIVTSENFTKKVVVY